MLARVTNITKHTHKDTHSPKDAHTKDTHTPEVLQFLPKAPPLLPPLLPPLPTCTATVTLTRYRYRYTSLPISAYVVGLQVPVHDPGTVERSERGEDLPRTRPDGELP